MSGVRFPGKRIKQPDVVWPEMPLTALCEAGNELIAGLARMMPGCRSEKTMLRLDQ